MHSVVALTAHLAQQHTRYPGTWRIGLMATGLSGVAAMTPRNQWEDPVPYTGPAEYVDALTRTTAQMAEQASEVTGALTRRLLRGFGVESQYLPYTPT